MNSDNNEQNNTPVQERVQVEDAQVIGLLRKNKIGKPMLAIEILIIFLIVIIALPFLNKMLEDENSVLHRLIYGASAPRVPTNVNPKGEFVNGGEIQTLIYNTKMKLDNIIIGSFTINSDNISCQISSYNEVINLDAEPYFFEIYSNNNELMSTVKLTGTYDYQEQDVILKPKNISFNTNMNYHGKIVSKSENDYPAVTINSDESGIGSLSCKKDRHSLNYTFKNGYLIKINDYEQILLEGKEEKDYLNLKKKYETKASRLNDNATVTENDLGFVFRANIDLEENNEPVHEKTGDYNYYPLDKEAKVIKYIQEAKGFDCK